MFSRIAKAATVGAVVTGVLGALGGLGLAAYWSATAQQPGVGWFILLFPITALPAAVVGALVGGATFALVQFIIESAK